MLFEEDFDSYPAGDLNTDYTNTTPGHGGWYYSGDSNTTAMITPETNKGNVLIIERTSSNSTGLILRQAKGTILWNNRTAGNNILKFEYEFYADDNFNVGGSILGSENNGTTYGGVLTMSFRSFSNFNDIRGTFLKTDPINYQTLYLQNFNTTVFPYNTWIKLEAFMDFNTNNIYFYLPMLNIQATGSFSHNRIPESVDFSIYNLNQSSIVKLDNIKVSALQTLPSHLVSVSKFVASKFNVFPNPVTDVVTITNSESIGIEQIEIFDISGKKVQSQNFSKESEVQLNMADFASGTYLLHIKTNEGTAVKKVVKK